MAEKNLLEKKLELHNRGKNVVIYGSGTTGVEVCKRLQANPDFTGHILGFTDSNRAVHGRAPLGVPVKSLDDPEYLALNPIMILATPIAWDRDAMRKACSDLGYETIDYLDIDNKSDTMPLSEAVAPNPSECFIYSPVGSLSVELVDSCNIDCVYCPRRYRKPQNIPANVIQPELLHRILAKGADAGIKHVSFFNWTEPFLHPLLDQFAEHAKTTHGYSIGLSSNMSLPHLPESRLIRTLSFTDALLVSVSGFTQEMHERYHKGSNITVVKTHLEQIAAAKKRGDIQCPVTVKYLDFDYNQEEIGLFAEYAGGLGLDFEVFYGSRHRACRKPYEEEVADLFAKMMPVYSEKRRTSLFQNCQYRQTLMVDYKGDAYLCCMKLKTPFFRVGNFLEDDLHTLQILRQTHPYCAICRMEYMLDDSDYREACSPAGMDGAATSPPSQ